MELPTRSLVLRVCQFRHDRINGFYYSLMFFVCQLILSHFLKILKIFLGTSKNRVKIRFFSQTAYMQNILHQAKTLQPTLINHRRFLHSRAETGFDVAQTQAYIIQELQQIVILRLLKIGGGGSARLIPIIVAISILCLIMVVGVTVILLLILSVFRQLSE